MSFTVAWVVWLLMFATIEGVALFRKEKGDTLSEHVWAWFGVRGKPAGYKWRRFGLLTFLVWLVVHLLSGGWV